MKNKSKKIISIILAATLSLSCLYGAFSAMADDLIPISSAYFPNASFRAIISEYYDDNSDGYLSADERSITSMSIPGMVESVLGDDGVLTDIVGIEYFPSLTILRCGGIGLDTLDVSKLTNLKSLTCQGNDLSELVVRNNVLLDELNCSDNKLTSLSLSYNINMTKLLCSENELTSLDTSALSKLTFLRCSNNSITSLDLSHNTALVTLICSGNNMKSLDLSANTSLTGVTSYNIGDQTITANGTASGDTFNIGVDIDASKIAITEADGYSNKAFYTTNYDLVANGFVYDYDTGIADAEPMDVFVNVEKTFYVVNFYTAAADGTLLSTEYVNSGETATAPTLPEAPQCKTFDSWSEPITNITEDKDVYIIWKDSHGKDKVTDFKNGVATLSCEVCGLSHNVNFKDYLNAKTGDANYLEALDSNSDGYINIRDYANFSNMYKD